MGLLGDLLALPVRIVEVPVKVIDKNIVDTGVSDVLDDIADDIEDFDD